MRLCPLFILLCGTICFAAQAAGGTHCGPNEESLWACSSKQKIYELCASRNLGKDRGYLQYRAGRIGNIELAYPPTPIHPRGLFKHQLYTRNGGLAFQNGKYKYELFDALVGHSELRVFQLDGRLVRDISCSQSNETFIRTDIINLFAEIGL